MNKTNTVTSKRDRIEYLDMARGIGILLVVIGHCLAGPDALDVWIYSFHMPLFFILSGWLYSHNKPSVNFTFYVKKKANTLLYPYIVFSILIITWKYILYYLFGSQPDGGFETLWWRSVSTYGYHSLWFLPTLFWTEIISHKIELSKKTALFKNLCYLGISLAGFCIFELRQTQGIAEYFLRYIGRICVAVMYYRAGMYLCTFMQVISAKMKSVFLFITFSFSLFMCHLNGFVNMSIGQIGFVPLYILLGLSGSMATILLCQSIGHSKFWGFLGKNSLFIMMAHMDFADELAYMIMAQTSIDEYFTSPTSRSVIAIIIGMLLLAIAAVLINRYFGFLLRADFLHANKNINRIKKA